METLGCTMHCGKSSSHCLYTLCVVLYANEHTLVYRLWLCAEILTRVYLHTTPLYHLNIPVHSRTLPQSRSQKLRKLLVPSRPNLQIHPFTSHSLAPAKRIYARESRTREQTGWLTQNPFCSLIPLISVIRPYFVISYYLFFFLTDITSNIRKHIRDYWAEAEVKRLALVLHSPARGWQLYNVALTHPSQGSV